ncbi:MAG: cytochrome c [Gammaproteobacteria bacterium]|nr:cytochrome c [Gammaproteobacteria bacterium]
MLNTKRSISLIIIALFSLAASANNLSLERQQQITHLVKQDCGSCHGMTLKGGLGTPLLPQDLAQKSVEFITFTILNGRLSTAMPPWQDILTRQEAIWIAEQLKRGTFNEK